MTERGDFRQGPDGKVLNEGVKGRGMRGLFIIGH